MVVNSMEQKILALELNPPQRQGMQNRTEEAGGGNPKGDHNEPVHAGARPGRGSEPLTPPALPPGIPKDFTFEDIDLPDNATEEDAVRAIADQRLPAVLKDSQSPLRVNMMKALKATQNIKDYFLTTIRILEPELGKQSRLLVHKFHRGKCVDRKLYEPKVGWAVKI